MHVTDFIRWALTHAKRETIPAGADLVLPRESCGVEPWQYLYGSVRVKTTQATLDLYYNNHYSKKMSRAQYDAITAAWDRNGYATDCQGLLDAWFTYEQGEKTDINANMNYLSWCSDKGEITKLDRPYVIGEALFMANSSGKMTHVGWVCGFAEDGGALVVEARGIAYGVVVTHINSRPWTHRGLMTKKFFYEEGKPMEKVRFEVASPMHTGEAYRTMQAALNAAGFTDADGKNLAEDGKWGKKSQAAFDSLIADYTSKALEVFKGANGKYNLILEVLK